MWSRVNKEPNPYGYRIWMAAFSCLLAFAATAVSADSPPNKRGGLVLQFDDGWTEWRTELAPELAKWNGKATVFVNNKYVASGRITIQDLLTLQNQFGWAIGTHTANHHHAPRFARQYGVQRWLADELEPSLAQFKEASLVVRSLVFPFNESTPELEAAALQHVECFRRRDRLAIADGIRADHSFPATSIDSTQFTPLPLLKQWIDLAHRRGDLLFLYGHRVLPDSAFVTGRIVSIEAQAVVVDTDVVLQPDEEYALVTDTERRAPGFQPLRVVEAQGRSLMLEDGAVTESIRAGSSFLLGPSYGTRLSEFRELVEYAAQRLNFYTIHDVLDGRHRK